MPIGAQPYFYSYFYGKGRELMAEVLGDLDPFSLSRSEIVERVLAAGYTPDREHVKRKPFVTPDKVSVVSRGGQTFIVSVDPEVKTIMVQEQRADPYPTAR